MKQKKQIFKKNKEFNLVVDFFGGLTNTAKVLDISYPYASHPLEYLFLVAIIAIVLFDKTWTLLWHIFYLSKPYSQTKLVPKGEEFIKFEIKAF
jgi:hypothetical protein